jgi:hypothetical protein
MIPVLLWPQVRPASNPALEPILRGISVDRLRSNVETLVGFGTRHTLSDTSSDERGIGAARRWIFDEFQHLAKPSQGRLSVWFDETVVPPSRRVPDSVRVTNVIAKLSGRSASDPAGERVLIVGAHYDSRATDPMDRLTDAPGANDDASGTAVVLELARVLSRHSFDATILFVAFAGEEQGLLGATSLAERALREGWDLEAMVNNDMVGNVAGADGAIDSTSVRLFAEALTPADTGSVLRRRRALGLENDGASRTLARYVQEVGDIAVRNLEIRMIYRRDRFLRGGDHSPFHDRGFAAVRLVEAKENYDRQHRNPVDENGRMVGDLPAFINYGYVGAIARTNAAVLTTLASAPRPPARGTLVLGGPVHSTTVRWAPNRELDLAGYNVRVRATTSPQWEKTFFTSDTSMTLAFPKDDYLFGIQAVDRAGAVSLVAMPSPGR